MTCHSRSSEPRSRSRSSHDLSPPSSRSPHPLTATDCRCPRLQASIFYVSSPPPPLPFILSLQLSPLPPRSSPSRCSLFPIPPARSRWSKCLGAMVPSAGSPYRLSFCLLGTVSALFTLIRCLLLSLLLYLCFSFPSRCHWHHTPCLSTTRLLPERCPPSCFIFRYSPLLLIYLLCVGLLLFSVSRHEVLSFLLDSRTD